MWAIFTVVVTFEFIVGGTISKCINKGIATTLADAFGLGAKYLAELIGKKEPSPIVLGVLVFIVGALGTFTRFYPHIKRRYDYGTMVFVLTFSLVAISNYRLENILQLVHRRISTIFIGIFTVRIISIVIRPVWAGEDLHKLVSTNLEKLASFLEGASIEFKSRTEEACKRMITESSKALKELALPIRTMTQLISSIIRRRNTENIIDDLKHTLGTSKIFFPHDESRVMDFIDVTSIVSLLVAITKCVDEIAKAIEELLDTWRHHNRNSGRDKKHQKRKDNL
ncbi:hypothetical protein P3L10_003306 [Capsicum annuum]